MTIVVTFDFFDAFAKMPIVSAGDKFAFIDNFDFVMMAAPHPRILFCSYHGYDDPTSGAALATRDLLELLAANGWACGVLCGPDLDAPPPETLETALRRSGADPQTTEGRSGSLPFRLHQFVQAGVPVTVFDPPARPAGAPPTADECRVFLELFDRVRETFRPDVVLTYGGHGPSQDLHALAKARGAKVVFALHNFSYADAAFFRSVDAVMVPSRFARDHYETALGLRCGVVPPFVAGGRVRCDRVEGRYATFVNPLPHKGVFVFARIARELARRRPDVPLLVVEGRAGVDWLGRTGVDLTGVTTVHRMRNTPDPRDFYRVSRLVLMPSLWWESFGRVAAEAMVNGIPVLASNRGALPETLGGAGFLFDVPGRYTPQSRVAPTAEEVGPWLRTIERLWDDPILLAEQGGGCRRAAEAWEPERMLGQAAAFFRHVVGG